MNITFEGQLAQREYTMAQWAHLKPRPFYAVLGVLVFGLMVWTIWVSFFGDHKIQQGAGRWVILGCLVWFLCAFFVWIPLRSRRLFRQYKAVQRPVRFQITDEFMKMESENGVGTYHWKEIVKWREGNGLPALSQRLLVLSDSVPIFPVGN